MQRSGIRQRGWWSVVLIGMLLIGLGIRVNGIFRVKAGLSHDESVSYLCAAATQSLYETGLPLQVDTPLVAADIQRYYAKPEHLQFQRVAVDLSQCDIHPPLYFWLLHAAHYAVGFDMRTGPLINVLLSLVLLVLLFQLGRSLFGGPLPALAVCAIWWLSPAVVAIDLEARHYQLFGVLAMMMFIVGRRIWNGAASLSVLLVFTAINALGLLTHYYYGFLLLPGTVIMCLRYRVSALSLRYVGSLAASFLLFLFCFPQFLDFVPSYIGHTDRVAGGPIDHVQRLKALLVACLDFFSHWQALAASVVLCICGVGLWAAIKKREAMLKEWRSSTSWKEIHFHLLWAGFFSVCLYLGGISPTQAVGGEYFSYIWPLLCLAITFWAQRMLSSSARGLVFAVFITQLAFSCWFAVERSPFVTNLVPESWYGLMERSDVVITNEGRRGYLPRMVTGLRPNMPLRICTQAGVDQFDPVELRSVAFWLSVRDDADAAPGLSERMKEAGFAEQVLRDGKHELRIFDRP